MMLVTCVGANVRVRPAASLRVGATVVVVVATLVVVRARNAALTGAWLGRVGYDP